MLETEIIKLREAIEALTAELGGPRELVDASSPIGVWAKTEVPNNQDEAKTEVPNNQDEAPKITDQDVKDATLAKSRDGFQTEIRALLGAFGVKKIQNLDCSDYAKYVDALGKIC